MLTPRSSFRAVGSLESLAESWPVELSSSSKYEVFWNSRDSKYCCLYVAAIECSQVVAAMLVVK